MKQLVLICFFNRCLFFSRRSVACINTYFLCAYEGEPSEILPNSQGKLKVLVPEISSELKLRYGGEEEGFDAFLNDFFDLHYPAQTNAVPIGLGIGNMWRLAIDHPESKVEACVHRAPREKEVNLYC